jgi:predicted kinase
MGPLPRHSASNRLRGDRRPCHNSAMPSPAEPPLIVVTGVPGAGKTTLSQQLGSFLGFAVVSLDTIKDELYSAGVHTDDRHALRLAAEEETFTRLGQILGPAILDIWIAPGRDDERVKQLLTDQPRWIVEVLCRVPSEVATARYANRSRGGSHLPPDAAMLDRIRVAATQIAPLGLGTSLQLDTSQPVSLNELAEVRTHVGC